MEKRLILHGDFLLQAIDGQTLSFEINYYLKDQNGGTVGMSGARKRAVLRKKVRPF